MGTGYSDLYLIEGNDQIPGQVQSGNKLSLILEAHGGLRQATLLRNHRPEHGN